MYIEDIGIESKSTSNFPKDSTEMLETLRQFRPKLNSSKYSIGIKRRKLLGYRILQQGLGVNPDKEKTVMEMRPPQTL